MVKVCLVLLLVAIAASQADFRFECNIYVNFTKQWYSQLQGHLTQHPSCWNASNFGLDSSQLVINSTTPVQVNEHGVLRTKQWQLDASGGCCHKQFQPPLERRRFDHPAAITNKTIVVGLQTHGTTYFHAIWEVLPRLLKTCEHPASPCNASIATLVTSSAIIAEFLRGTTSWHVVTLPPGHSVASSTVILPTNAVSIPRHERVQLLFQMAEATHLPASVPSPRRILLVERDPQGSHARAILNSADLRAALQRQYPQHRVDVFNASRHSLQATLAQWTNVELIVAPHGAGLTNLIWLCRDGCAAQPRAPLVVELVPEHQTGRYYHQLAEAAGVRHAYYELVEKRGTGVKTGRNWVVKIEPFLRFLKRVDRN